MSLDVLCCLPFFALHGHLCCSGVHVLSGGRPRGRGRAKEEVAVEGVEASSSKGEHDRHHMD